MIRNKKADLRDDIPGILIAVLCLALIVWFAVHLFGIFSENETKNVKSTIESIEGKLKLLTPGQESFVTLQGFKGAENWFLYGWGANSQPAAPDACLFKSCICICKRESGVGITTAIARTRCETDGICKQVENAQELSIYTNYTKIKDTNGEITIYPGIKLAETSIQIILKNDNNKLLVAYYNDISPDISIDIGTNGGLLI